MGRSLALMLTLMLVLGCLAVGLAEGLEIESEAVEAEVDELEVLLGDDEQSIGEIGNDVTGNTMLPNEQGAAEPTSDVYFYKSGTVITGLGGYEDGEELHITIPDDATGIDENAFSEIKGLKSVVIPDSVTWIGANAFSDCGLVSVTLGSGVQEIGDCAFSGCKALAAAELPDSLTQLGKKAFLSCESLARLKLSSGLTAIPESAFEYCAALTAVEIPEGVKTIGMYAFSNCAGVERLVIPGSVTEIEMDAFFGLKALKEVAIPGSVASISDYAFRSCSSLTSVSLGNGVASIGRYAFADCGELESIVLPESVEALKDYAFRECGKLASVTFKRTEFSVGSSVFYMCSNALTLYVPCNATRACSDLRWRGYQVSMAAHVPTAIPAVAPTCTEEGLTKGSSCAVCGSVIDAQQVIPAKGHRAVTDKAVKATYTKTGLTKGSHCKVCGAVLVKQQVTPKLTVPENGLLLTKSTSRKAYVGDKIQILLNGLTAKRYSSDKPAVAKVSGKGLVSVLKKGVATITVTTREKKTFKLKITASVRPTVTGIGFKQGKSGRMEGWQDYKLVPVFKPAGAMEKVKWKSSDTSVAKVLADGTVIPQKEAGGTVVITATTTVSKLQATFKLTVGVCSARAGNLEDYVGKDVYKGLRKNMKMFMIRSGNVYTYKSLSSFLSSRVCAGVDGRNVVKYIDITEGSLHSLFYIHPGLGSTYTSQMLDKHGWTYSRSENGMSVYTSDSHSHSLRIATDWSGKVTRIIYGDY